jgi:hypothetical protein
VRGFTGVVARVPAGVVRHLLRGPFLRQLV